MTAAPRLRLPSWPICRSSQLPGHQESRRRCWTSPDTSQCLRRPNCALYRLRGAQVNLKASLRALAYAGARSGLRGAQLPNSSSSRQWRTRHRLHSVVVDTTNQPKRNARGDVRIPSLGGRPQLHRSKLSGHGSASHSPAAAEESRLHACGGCERSAVPAQHQRRLLPLPSHASPPATTDPSPACSQSALQWSRPRLPPPAAPLCAATAVVAGWLCGVAVPDCQCCPAVVVSGTGCRSFLRYCTGFQIYSKQRVQFAEASFWHDDCLKSMCKSSVWK